MRPGFLFQVMDDLVTDVAVNLPLEAKHRRGDVGNETPQELMVAQVAEALGDLGGGSKIDEEKDAILFVGRVVAAGHEPQEHAAAEKLVELCDEVDDRGDAKTDRDGD